MVSNLTSVFLSTSSEEQPTPAAAMVLIPTVTVQEVPKEVEIVVLPAEPIPSSSEVQVVEVLAPNENEVKPEDEPCELCTKVQNYVKTYYDYVRGKLQQLADRLMDPSLHETIRTEFFDYLPSFLLILASFFFLITFVSFIKLMSHGVHNEPSFFCRYFSGPFSPLFDAICEPEPFVFSNELPRVMSGLIDEMMHTIAEFFRTVCKGFTVFGTLFTAIYQGLRENVFFGFHELGENLGENINHLIHFIVQFFHQVIYFILSSIATLAGAIAGVFTSVHDYLEPKPAVW
uniref:Chloride channel CLIC-like protein 1 n=2 Tax=Caenorhabditis tropicalis TaxID=1561998 RepID=A0A1I7UQS0_9PELO